MLKKSVALLLVLISFLFVGCMDIGDVDDFDQYYDRFGIVRFVHQSDSISPQIDTISMSTLYNKETADKVMSVMTPYNYKYFAIQIKNDLKIEDIGFFVGGRDFQGKLEMELYLRQGFPSAFFGDMNIDKIEGRYEYQKINRVWKDGLPKYELVTYSFVFDGYGTVTDQEGHTASYTLTYDRGYPFAQFIISYEVTVSTGTHTVSYGYSCKFATDNNQVDYNNVIIVCTNLITQLQDSRYVYTYKGISTEEPEAQLTNKIATVSVALKNGVWSSFTTGKLLKGDTKVKYIEVKAGDYIFVKVLNNCNGAHRRNLSPVDLEISNILIRSLQ